MKVVKNSKGVTLVEILIILVVLILSIFVTVTAAISFSMILEAEIINAKPIAFDLFNGLEVPVQDWMFSIPIEGKGYSVKSVAEEWCLSHSIPADQREVKIKELIEKFQAAISGLTIKLAP